MQKKWVLRFNASTKASTDSFKALKAGTKTVETRAATDKYRRVSPGDVLIFKCGKEELAKEVQKAKVFPSIEAMAKAIDKRRINPWAKSLKELKDGYDSYPGYHDKIKEEGIVAFWI